ncbi:MAG: hypothetical protein EOP47_30475 [Sphingobacteriaceae bacterium]|nr:MAG: hypothetical protein EOP47_30475 [Sphingobacteriaceae bacterium]
MKYIVGFVSMLLFTHTAFAQCKSGNCTNGKGVYDFGWCVYEGDFKNGKPDGKGSMKYDDYTYDGEFKNGVEDGLGTLTYKNGKQEKVVFGDGKKIAFEPIKVNAADFKISTD